jgi:ribonuclease-3
MAEEQDQEPEQEQNWDAVRTRLGVDGAVGDAVLQQAMSHPSWCDEQGLHPHESNQRLEFLGDAVLGLVVADHLFQELDQSPEGVLTRLKSEAVKRETLARLARRLELGDFVLLGPQERASGGARKPSILADCVEALIGAVYLAQGMPGARDFVLRILRDDLEELAGGSSPLDPKSEIQQLLQALAQQLPEYVTASQQGPPHARTFTVEVRFAGRTLGSGSGTSKQRAQQAAARDALERRQEWLPELQTQAK